MENNLNRYISEETIRSSSTSAYIAESVPESSNIDQIENNLVSESKERQKLPLFVMPSFKPREHEIL